MEWLEPTRLVLAFIMLAGAAVLDIRTRRVRNGYWLPFAAAAALLLLWDAWVSRGALSTLLWPLAFACLLSLAFYAMWRFGLFGGADSKGLIVLAFLVPRPLPHGLLSWPFAFDALTNGALLVMLVPILLLVWNLLRGHASVPAALLGIRMTIDAAESNHVWPMQAIGDDGALHWHYWHRPGRSQDKVFADLRAAGIDTVWATPKIPFMTFAAAGAFVAWQVGNIILVVLQGLLS